MRALSTFSSNSWTISPPSTSEQHVSRRSFVVVVVVVDQEIVRL